MTLFKRHIVALAIVVSGCATTSPTAPSFSEAPVPTQRSDVAVLYVIRESAVPYAFLGYIDIDGKPAVQLAEQGFTWVYVKPGTRTFKHYWPILAAMPSVTFKRDLVAGQTYVFEMKGNIGGGRISTAMHMVPVEEAPSKMTACCRYTKPIDDKMDY